MIMAFGAADREIERKPLVVTDTTIRIARATLARLAAKKIPLHQRTEVACHFLAGIETAFSELTPWEVEAVEQIHSLVFLQGASVLEEIIAPANSELKAAA